MTGPERQRPGRLEIVGAWLGLWTPPKDAIVQPFPKRRAAAAALLLAVAITAAGVFAVPRIDQSKRSSAERERRGLLERREAERRRLTADQVAVRGSVRRPQGRLSAGQERRARRGLLRALERAITTEARSRVTAGALTGRVARTECTPGAGGGSRRAERDPRVRRGAYECLAVTSEIPATRSNPPGRLGHPFRAVVDFRRSSFVFCKTNPPPGERAVPDPRGTPALPRGCTGP